MELRFDPTSLFEPGTAEDFFLGQERVGAFDPGAEGFDPAQAWWLSELSRAIYRDSGAGRSKYLARVGLGELLCFEEAPACQGALVASADPARPWSALVFRGTSTPQDWLTNGQAFLGAWDPGGQVHTGFRDALLREWPRIAGALRQAPGPLFMTGHSLGGALATLAASLWPPHALYTFGSPRVGTAAFADSLRCPTYRVVNNRDAVTEVPLPLANLGFSHAGELHYFDHAGRPSRAPSQVAVAWDRLLPEVEHGRAFTDLPKFLTDHAPVNYSALLARLAASRER